MNGEEAIAWVDMYQGLVRKKVWFLTGNNTPYDLEDFLHDAYEAALKAARLSRRKGISFSSVFWQLFRKNVLRVTPCPLMKRSDGVSMSVFDCQEYSDDLFYGCDAYLADPEEILLGNEAGKSEGNVLFLLMERLTPVEKKVISRICGLQGPRLSLSETARRLRMSKGAVHQSYRRSMKKALQLREDCLSTGFPLQGKSARGMNNQDELSFRFIC